MTSPRVTLVSALGVSRITSEEYEPPLGVLTLAAILRQSFPVCVVDLDHEWLRASRNHEVLESRVVDAVTRSRPDILGFSSISGSYPMTVRLAQLCAVALPETTIIFGGPQATVTDAATLNTFPFIDMILRGEADDTLPTLVAAIASGSAISRIPGLTYRRCRRIHRNPNAPAILDMDRLPLPAFDLIPSLHQLRTLPIEVGRGCPYTCSFCSTNDFFRRRFRLKSPAHVLDEMIRLNGLNSVQPVTTFQFIHDMFTVDRKRVVEFCETLKNANFSFTWSCSARSDSVDSDLLRLMRDAGCRAMFFGIETGSRRMQRVIDKDLDLEVARTVLRETNRLGVHSDASLIIGYPQETREDLRDSVNFYADAMMMLWVDPQLNVISPLAGTPLTTQYSDQLYLDDDWADISECGTLQNSVDKLMIEAHPDLFTNFYGMPYYTRRNVLRRLHDFLFYGRARCGGLLRAIYRHTGDMFAVFEEWEQSTFNDTSGQFGSLDFANRLISFSEANYPSVPSIVATARFYRNALDRAHAPKESSYPSVPHLRLEEEIVIVDSPCDIRAVLKALTHGVEPDAAAFSKPSTVVLSPTSMNRSNIRQFPAPYLELLLHAEKATPLDEIRRDFAARHITLPGLSPEKMVTGGIECLEEQKLVRRVFPAAESRNNAQGNAPLSLGLAAAHSL